MKTLRAILTSPLHHNPHWVGEIKSTIRIKFQTLTREEATRKHRRFLLRCLVMGMLFFTVISRAATRSNSENLKATKRANTVFIDEIAVRNLRLKTIEAEERTFEEILFALGRIEVRPGYSAVLSSRIAGRAVKVDALPDHKVDKGETLVIVESAQSGNPPPQINLSAPITGVISEINVVLGEPINPDRSLLKIVDLSSVYGVARVPETMAGKLREGLPARIRVPGWPDQEWDAKVEHIGAVADRDSGTLEAAFHIKNLDFKLRPGMRAEFSIITSRREGVMSVPKQALQGEPANRFLYVADETIPYAFVKIPVEIGSVNDRFVEIVRGLFPKDKVVTEGAYSLVHAGKGTMSLKEALDAAHGHEHSEDGGELTPDQRRARQEKSGAVSSRSLTPLTIFSLCGNVALLALLGVQTWRRRSPTEWSLKE